MFIPAHNKKFGRADAILLLDNCPAHNVDMTQLPSWLDMIFLPPNMTSNYQPADMGMIASLKMGYKTIMLTKLLEIFDAEGGYEAAAKFRMRVKRGQRGLDYGGKATILDAMQILTSIWNVDGRYAREDGIARCWRKANILPVHMNTAINADLGSNTIPAAQKYLSKDDCDELCSLMKSLKMKANEASLNCNTTAIALQGSFAADGSVVGYDEDDFNTMIENWIEVEDDPFVMEAICEDEIEEIESNQKPAAAEDDGDDEEPETMEVEVDESEAMTYLEAVDALEKLIVSAPKLGVSEAATVHLDRFAKALNAAHVKKPRRDSTLHSYFFSKNR